MRTRGSQTGVRTALLPLIHATRAPTKERPLLQVSPRRHLFNLDIHGNMPKAVVVRDGWWSSLSSMSSLRGIFFLYPPGYWFAPPECSAWVDPPGSLVFHACSYLLAIRVLAVSSSLFTCPQISSIVLVAVLPSSTSWILTPQGNSKHVSVAMATAPLVEQRQLICKRSGIDCRKDLCVLCCPTLPVLAVPLQKKLALLDVHRAYILRCTNSCVMIDAVPAQFKLLWTIHCWPCQEDNDLLFVSD